jgi:hypothetical protein
MAAPPLAARIIPIANRLDVGYQSVLVFHAFAALAIFEKTVQPPGGDGGAPIMTTTMLNLAYETKAPQRLRGYSDGVVVAAYDPKVVAVLDELINLPTSITFGWPDGTAAAFWAYLQKYEFSALEKDKQPDVTLTVTVTNWDPVNCVEAGPVHYNGTGSCGPYTVPSNLGNFITYNATVAAGGGSAPATPAFPTTPWNNP